MFSRLSQYLFTHNCRDFDVWFPSKLRSYLRLIRKSFGGLFSKFCKYLKIKQNAEIRKIEMHQTTYFPDGAQSQSVSTFPTGPLLGLSIYLDQFDYQVFTIKQKL